MLASLKKIFTKEEKQEGGSRPPDLSLPAADPAASDSTEKEAATPGTPAIAIPGGTPTFKMTVSEKGGDSDDEDTGRPLMSQSCPVVGNPRMHMPLRPRVKPAAAPQAALLPNLELPPSLPNDYQIPQPDPIPQETFSEMMYAQAASCPPAFRLPVNLTIAPTDVSELAPGGLAVPMVHIEGTPMANSPLIYEVLVSGCLMGSLTTSSELKPSAASSSSSSGSAEVASEAGALGGAEPAIQALSLSDKPLGSPTKLKEEEEHNDKDDGKDDDELPEMEL